MSEGELFTVRNVAGAVSYAPNVAIAQRLHICSDCGEECRCMGNGELCSCDREERVRGSGVCASNEARGNTYPNTPGFKREGTSKLAAEEFASEDEKLKNQVLKVLSLGDYTSDEIAERLKRTPFSIRPRVSQLFTKGKIADTGLRRKNESGHPATVWKINDYANNP